MSDLLLPGEAAMPEPDHFAARFADYACARSAVSRRHALYWGWAIEAAVIRRRLAYPLASGAVYIVLWALLLARSGVGKKSTLYGMGAEIVESVDPRLMLPNEFSLAGLLTELASKERKDAQGGSIGLFAKDEAAGFLAGLAKLDYQTGGRDLLLDLSNSRPAYVKRLRGETFELSNVGLTLLLTGVPSRIAASLTAEDWYSGFVGRFAIALPEAELPYRDVGFADVRMESARVTLTAELRDLSTALPADGKHLLLGADELDRFNRYGRDLEAARDDAPEPLAASYARLPDLALRIAALIAVTSGADLDKPAVYVPMAALVAGIRHAETARADAHAFHDLYSGVATEAEVARVVAVVGAHPGMKRRDVQPRVRTSKERFAIAWEEALGQGRILEGPDGGFYARASTLDVRNARQTTEDKPTDHAPGEGQRLADRVSSGLAPRRDAA